MSDDLDVQRLMAAIEKARQLISDKPEVLEDAVLRTALWQ
jgi:hypothetical protein